jgi:endogenous inhibitor of DNA gyrase (YacG/DUF329 family)
MASKQQQSSAPGRCPICAAKSETAYRPFCSARCRDVDLGRWFGEVYTVPAVEPGYEEEEDDGEPVSR